VETVSDLYRQQKERLFAYILRMTGDFELSCDILQESFSRLLEHYGPEGGPAPLLFAIARNMIFDHARKKRVQTPIDPDTTTCPLDTEKGLMIRQAYQEVLGAMQTLEESERDILSLVVSSDLSYRQIGEVAGLTEANVKVKVHRARLKLRKILQGDIFDGLCD